MRKLLANWPCAAALAAAALLAVPGVPDAFEGPKRLVWCALALALSACALRRALRRDRPVAAAPAFLLFGCALLAWMTIRSLAVAPFWRAIQPLAAWLLPPLLCIAAASVPWSDVARRNAIRATVALALLEATLMLLQRAGLDPLFGGTTRTFDYVPQRMIGTVGYHNQAAEFLGVALFCVPAATTRRPLRLAFAVLLGAAIGLTANRGAIFAVVVIAAAAAVFEGWRNKWGGNLRLLPRLLPLLLLPLLLLAVPAVCSRLAELATPSSSVAVQSRLWMDRVALSLWRDHPFLGGGAGSFAYEYIDRLGNLLPARKEHVLLRCLVWARETHCDPLQFAAEFGAAGILILVAFLLFLVRDIPPSAHARAALRASAFLSVCSLFSFSWQTSLAAPAAALLMGMAFSQNRAADKCGKSISVGAASMAAALSLVVSFAAIADNAMNFDNEDACWDAISGEPSSLLHGRWLANAVKFGLANEAFLFAAEGSVAASSEWLSPVLLVAEAQSLETVGLGDDALDVWHRLARCGLRHGEALRGLSLCLERLERKQESAAVERERFRLWYKDFSDAELYRLCALSLLTKDASYAEWISRRFMNRCGRHGELKSKWTPEWANIRGSALLLLGAFEEARECFEDALRRKPSLTSASRNLDALKKRTSPQ